LIGNDTDVFGAIFSTLFEVIFLYYILFALDLFYDIDLIEAYRDKSWTFGSKDNTTINWSNGTFRYQSHTGAGVSSSNPLKNFRSPHIKLKMALQAAVLSRRLSILSNMTIFLHLHGFTSYLYTKTA